MKPFVIGLAYPHLPYSHKKATIYSLGLQPLERYAVFDLFFTLVKMPKPSRLFLLERKKVRLNNNAKG